MTVVDLTEAQRQVILTLCRDGGDTGTEEDLVAGFVANHLDRDGELLRDLEAAAAGDVLATIRLRTRCGLPLIA